MGQLVGQGSTQVLVQLQQGPQEAPLQRCKGWQHRSSGHGPPCQCSPVPTAPAHVLPPCPGWHRPLPFPESPGTATLSCGEGEVPGETWGGLERPREP